MLFRSEKIRASELVKQFKLEMAMGEEAAPTEEARLQIPERETEEGAKTIGRERTQAE